MGRIDLDDLNWERRRYRRWAAYGQSKLANLLFTYELQRRWAAAGSRGTAFAAHPGYAATNLQSHTDSFQDRVMEVTNRVVAQSAEMGALPALYAATQPRLAGGSFVGPDGLFEQRGYPTDREVVPTLLRPGHRPVAVDPVGKPDRGHLRIRLSPTFLGGAVTVR